MTVLVLKKLIALLRNTKLLTKMLVNPKAEKLLVKLLTCNKTLHLNMALWLGAFEAKVKVWNIWIQHESFCVSSIFHWPQSFRQLKYFRKEFLFWEFGPPNSFRCSINMLTVYIYSVGRGMCMYSYIQREDSWLRQFFRVVMITKI